MRTGVTVLRQTELAATRAADEAKSGEKALVITTDEGVGIYLTLLGREGATGVDRREWETVVSFPGGGTVSIKTLHQMRDDPILARR